MPAVAGFGGMWVGHGGPTQHPTYVIESLNGAVILMIAAAHQGKAGSYAAACPKKGGHAARTQGSHSLRGPEGPEESVEGVKDDVGRRRHECRGV